jgi:hypothetical protein
MTNRRGFLGLLAAAPLVAPVIAKEMAASQYASGSTFEPLYLDFMKFAPGERLYSFGIEPVRDGLISPNEMRQMLDLPPIGDIPNRLYGARINSDGDAV